MSDDVSVFTDASGYSDEQHSHSDVDDTLSQLTNAPSATMVSVWWEKVGSLGKYFLGNISICKGNLRGICCGGHLAITYEYGGELSYL